MPFDVGDFSGASFSDRAASRRNRRLVAGWLFTLAAMVLVMIGLGGATRLSGSGLSIMEWAPILGTLPPLSQQEWDRLFALYRQIPQFALTNSDFTLQDFKGIFWLEWTHRFWGRLLGLAFGLPLLWLWLTGRIDRRVVPRLLALFALGGVQALVGWFMVASGFLPDATTVSPYRLVVHLSLALILYAGLIWIGLSLTRPSWTPPAEANASNPAPANIAPVRALAILSLVVISLTIVAGGFVAGTRAGLTYNTFPLMDGRLFPEGYFGPLPLLRNLAENVTAVQFNHRLLATISAMVVLTTLIIGWRTRPAPPLRLPLILLGGCLIVQYTLGVITLLHAVPLLLGTAHQLCASLLLAAAIVLLHTTLQDRQKPGSPG
jgi:cytochrome c oxidase assembly protein subunit 15